MLIRTGIVYQTFKYAIYALLAINTAAYFTQNFESVAETRRDGLAPAEIIVAYSDAIDTAAWLVLLLLLELETFVIPDEKIKGWVDGAISAASFLCWAFILYSLYGYIGSVAEPYGFAPLAGRDPCADAEAGALLAKGLGDYVPFAAEDCAALAAGALYNSDYGAYATADVVSTMKRLAWTDVVNASVWVGIVVILELEIYLKSSKLFGSKFFLAYKSFKLLLYAILLVDAFYWLALGDPLGAWDAFLWLVAFFFIEMNMLAWQEENARKAAAGAPASFSRDDRK